MYLLNLALSGTRLIGKKIFALKISAWKEATPSVTRQSKKCQVKFCLAQGNHNEAASNDWIYLNSNILLVDC